MIVHAKSAMLRERPQRIFKNIFAFMADLGALGVNDGCAAARRLLNWILTRRFDLQRENLHWSGMTTK
ncbi:MAG TPA: hypothetical protein VIF12_03970 [Micavibrio sp.]|jgi:hypothetical protein